MKVLFASLALALLAGCATVGSPTGAHKAGKLVEHPTVENKIDGCTVQQQKDCIEFRFLNIATSDAEMNPGGLLHGLDRPHHTQEERLYRASELGPRLLFEGVRTGRLKAGEGREFQVFLYGLNKPVIGHFQAYRVNLDIDKKDVVTKTSFYEEVGGYYPQFDPAYPLGQPDLVLRVKAAGSDAIAASIQLPKAMMGPNFHMLVCTLDSETVYPNKLTAKQGHWTDKKVGAWYVGRGTTRVLKPFVSKS